MTQSKVGWRPYVSPIVPASTLLTGIYSVWNAEGSNNLTVKNAWNANGNAIDSKSGANGTIAAPSGTTFTTGTMSFGSGKLGSGAFTFNGSNFISLPGGTLNFTGDFSFSMWIYVPTAFGANACRVLVAFDNTLGYTTYRGWDSTYSNGAMNFTVYPGLGDSYYAVSVPMTLKDQWVHVAVTKPLAQQATIYINGVAGTKTVTQRSSGASTNIISYNGSNNLAYIGASYYAFSLPYYTPTVAGGFKIDSIQTWETTLDQTAITELYNSGAGQEYPFTVSNALISSPKDAVGSKNGTLMNGCAYTTGKIGKAFTFDGVNDYISYPNDTFKLAGNFSINVWVKLNAIGSTQAILASGTGTSNGFRMYVASNNKIYFEYNGSYFTGTTTLAANAWYNIVLTNNGSIFKLYINGALNSTNASFGSAYQTITWATSGTNLAMIGRYISSAYYLNGYIDSTTVWEKELTSTEVTDLYNSGNGKQYPNY